MQTEQLPPLTVNLPERLAEVFRSLRSGRHICRDDIADYRDLERNEDLYQALLAGLGYELVHHGQGFYYLKGGNTLTTQRLQAITLFMLILFQDLEDKKFQEADRSWERSLLTRTFSVNELPHFQTSQRRSMLYTVGVTADTLQEKVLRSMIRMGMLEMVGPDRFQFRSPVYRFVDVCMRFADEAWKPTATDQPESFDAIDEQTDVLAASDDIDEGDDAS
jgi:chromosome condensin MukBEF MukE localization factor